MTRQPETRDVEIALVTTLRVRVTLTGARLAAVDHRTVENAFELVLPPGVEVLRTDAGYLRAGRLSEAQQAAVLRLITPDLTPAAIAAGAAAVLGKETR